MNSKPVTKRPKWYVGIRKDSNYQNVDILKLHADPVSDLWYPAYAYFFGGYKTKKEAVQVANYHNYRINP